MLAEFQFTDARKDFSSLYNEVFNTFKPIVIKRKQVEEVAVLRTDLLKMVLSNYSMKPEVCGEVDGSTTISLDQLEIYSNGETFDEALFQLIQDLKFYAQDYIERSQLFLNAPNRREHFPYILRILLCENDNEIRSTLEL